MHGPQWRLRRPVSYIKQKRSSCDAAPYAKPPGNKACPTLRRGGAATGEKENIVVSCRAWIQSMPPDSEHICWDVFNVMLV
jgi:hypothetical protein